MMLRSRAVQAGVAALTLPARASAPTPAAPQACFLGRFAAGTSILPGMFCRCFLGWSASSPRARQRCEQGAGLQKGAQTLLALPTPGVSKRTPAPGVRCVAYGNATRSETPERSTATASSHDGGGKRAPAAPRWRPFASSYGNATRSETPERSTATASSRDGGGKRAPLAPVCLIPHAGARLPPPATCRQRI
jgi:hypothetical protein